MRIVNVTQDRVLADKVQEAYNWKQRLKGLLGQAELKPGEALFIRPCSSIHSLFMRFRFDAVFIDKKGKVLHLIQAMKPWRISKIVFGAWGVLELPEGVLSETNTVEGDCLVFHEG